MSPEAVNPALESLSRMDAVITASDPSGAAIKTTLGELVGGMVTNAPSAIEPGTVLARLVHDQRLPVALPNSQDPLAELIRRLALMNGSTLLDPHGRKYRIRKKASAAGFVFMPKFID